MAAKNPVASGAGGDLFPPSASVDPPIPHLWHAKPSLLLPFFLAFLFLSVCGLKGRKKLMAFLLLGLSSPLPPSALTNSLPPISIFCPPPTPSFPFFSTDEGAPFLLFFFFPESNILPAHSLEIFFFAFRKLLRGRQTKGFGRAGFLVFFPRQEQQKSFSSSSSFFSRHLFSSSSN